MGNELRDHIRQKVPEALQTKEYNLLLSLIKEHNLSSAEELKSFVDTNIGTLNTQLKEKRASTTMNSEIRMMAKEVDVMQAIKDQFFKLL